MSVVVVGSMAFDSLETPMGKREQALGGSANYFSLCASNFTDVKLVAVVGEDFPAAHIKNLESRGVDCEGLARSPGKTFHWSGRYGKDLNEAETLDTQLNVFADFEPKLPDSYRRAETVFLANIDPTLQLSVLEQIDSPKVVAMDTMNFWIEGKRAELEKVIAKVDMLFVNDGEARLLSGEHNIVKAAKAIQELGVETVVIKRGEYGALYFHQHHIFFCPAYPLEEVVDPTGAGDTFAGGFLGWVDRNLRAGAEQVDAALAKQAMVMGTVMASHVVEGFSFDRVLELKADDILERWRDYHKLTDYDVGIDYP